MKTKMNSRVKVATFILPILSVLFYISCTKNANNEDITEENLPPEAFNLLLPDNGVGPCSGVGPGFAQIFSWDEAKDPEGDEIRYTLLVGSTQDPTTVVASDLLETSFTLPEIALNPGQQYYWKVRAMDALGNITESEVFTFFAATLC